MNTGKRAVGALCAIAATVGMLAGGGVAWADDGATASARAIDEGGGRWTLEHTLEWAASMTSGTMPVEQTTLVSYDTSADADAVRTLIERLAPLAGNAYNRLCVAGDDGGDFECADGADHEFAIRTGGAADHAGGWERLFDQAAKEEGVVTVVQAGAADSADSWDTDRYAPLAGQAGAKTDGYIITLPGASNEGAAAARACAEAAGARYVDGGDDTAVEAVLDAVGSRQMTSWRSNFTTLTGLSFRLTDHVVPDWTTFSRDDVTLAFADGSEIPDGWTASWDAETRTVTVSFPEGWRAPGLGGLAASIHVVSRRGTNAATADAAWTYTSSAGVISWKGEQTTETLHHTAAVDPLIVTGDGTAALPPVARAEASGDAATGRWTLTHSFTGSASSSTSASARPVAVYVSYDDSYSMNSRKEQTAAALSALARSVLAVSGSSMYVSSDSQGGSFTRVTDPDQTFQIVGGMSDNHYGGFKRLVRETGKDASGARRVAIQLGDGADLSYADAGSPTEKDPWWTPNDYAATARSLDADYYIVSFGDEDGQTGAAEKCAKAIGGTWVNGSGDRLEEAFETIARKLTVVRDGQRNLGLSFRLADDVTPDWTAFSRDDVTLGLSDGSAVPDGWSAAWDEATRTVTVAMPADWEAPDGVSLSASVDVTSAVGGHEATSDAAWTYTTVADGTRSRLEMDPLTVSRNASLSATLPATGGLMGAVGFAAVMLGLAALLARRRARAALHV